MGYDAVDSSKSSKKRRQPVIETQDDHKILTNLGRLRSINLARDLQRNYVDGAAHLRQFRNAAVADGPKLAIQTDDEAANEQIDTWFNGVYAHSCSARDNSTLRNLVALVLQSLKREGDVVVSFDDYLFDDGKLWFWEADQICNLSEDDWKRNVQFPVSEGYTQDEGIVYDKFGREVGYIVSSVRGSSSVSADQATILPNTVAKLIKDPWRLNQRRGISELLNPGAMYQDSYEILSKELQSAKVAAGLAGVVKRTEGAEAALFGQGIDPEAIIDSTSSAVATAPAATNYDNLEALTGGYLEYMQPGDEFQIQNWNRPNINLKDFLDRVTSSAGASLGLSKTYATLTPAGSYTAFRGDMLLAWSQFRWDQKTMEQQLCDWIATKAIGWASRHGLTVPDGYELRLTWIWPDMPAVDEMKAQSATSEALANMSTNYSEILGPNWRKKLTKAAEQAELLRQLGISHARLPWTPAAPSDTKTETDEDEEAQEQNENI